LFRLTNGIGDSAIDQIYEIARNARIKFGDAVLREYEAGYSGILTGKKRISDRINLVMKSLEKVDVPESASWGNWIIEQSKGGNIPEITDDFTSLLQKIDSWPGIEEKLPLKQYINQIEPLIKDMTNSKSNGQLRIMTLNGAKGLTVKATIIAGVEDGIIPFPTADRQEERRLLYVGMTRAQEYLILTRSRRRTGPTARSGRANVAGTRSPSPFLNGGPVRQMDGDAEFRNLGI
jgi:superfamily I DNA/RNA helicase